MMNTKKKASLTSDLPAQPLRISGGKYRHLRKLCWAVLLITAQL